MLFCLGSQVGFVHLKGKNGNFKQALNITQWRYSIELVVRSSHRHNCKCAKNWRRQPVRNKTVKPGRQEKMKYCTITYVWNLKLKKKREETERTDWWLPEAGQGCGSSGWNGRMSEEKESKKNIDSIS